MEQEWQLCPMFGIFFLFCFFRVEEMEKQVKKIEMFLRDGLMPVIGDKNMDRSWPKCSQQRVRAG